MIEEFKIHANYLIEGANINVTWKTKDALFIKFHIDSWTKGWLKNNDSIKINLNRDVKKITLYAIGFEKIEKKEIDIKLNKFKEVSIRGKKIKKNEFRIKKYDFNTITNLKPINKLKGLKSNEINLTKNKIKPKINYNKLKLENHE